MLRVVRNGDAPVVAEPEELGLDEICRLAARQMLASALLAERRAYLEGHGQHPARPFPDDLVEASSQFRAGVVVSQ
jgi:hypothetical protein